MLSRLALVLAALLAVQAAARELVIENADRQVLAQTQRMAVSTVLAVKNAGSAAAAEVVLCEPAVLQERAAMYEVGRDVAGKLQRLDGQPARPEGAPGGVACTAYPLDLAPGAGATLVVKAVYTGMLRPDPAEIMQGEPQRVVLHAPLYLSSPYRVAKQSTKVELGSGAVESYTQAPEPVARKGGQLTYGPYANVAPWATGDITVHYENNWPFAAATELVREVQISHWGNVYFEESYSLVHRGAKIKGEWSRLDYMARPEYTRTAIRELQATLMPAAHSIYFRDGIGNISTSAMRREGEAVTVGLAPRFPLFGGWTSRFLFGWSLPMAAAVSRAKGRNIYSLTSLLGPSVRDLVVDDLTVRVVLPEGATFEALECQLELEQSLEKKYTYFDTAGRTVVVLRRHNMVPEMNVPFSVTYNFPPTAMLRKPLLLVAAFAAFYVLLMTLTRADVRISSNGSAKEHAS